MTPPPEASQSGCRLNRPDDADIRKPMNRLRGSLVSIALAAGAHIAFAPAASADPHDALVRKHAAANAVPEALVRRVIHIESRGNPRVVSKGNYGLMQIRLGTARSMGYSGDAQGLLDADTNMTYAVRYLANAYRAAGCNIGRAIAYYQRGFYKKPQMRCGASVSDNPAIETRTIAFEENARGRASADARLTAATMRPGDVLKPRVVPTEKIIGSAHAATPSRESEPRRPRGSFNPLRGEPSSETAVASLQPKQPTSSVAGRTTATVPMPKPRPVPQAEAAGIPATDAMSTDAMAAADGAAALSESAGAEQVAALDPQTIPLPPSRPEIAAVPEAKPVRRAARRTARHAKPKQQEPSGVTAFLQKLTAPEKKTRKAKAGPQTAAPHTAPIN